MADAPERIWVDDERPIGGQVHVWDEMPDDGKEYCTEYVRADLTPSWHRIDDPDNPPPKDGTKILAYDGIGTFTVEWHSCGWMGSEVDGDPLPSDDLPITHWMHLPQPPKEGE
jgi:hypothetical protein